MNFQILRRTWVTLFSQAEKDLAVRSKIAGHSIDVHENEYRQTDPAVARRAMRKLEDLLQ